MSSQGTLFTTYNQAIATVSFGHVASNAFPTDLLHRLTEQLHQIAQQKEVSVIVLQSEGQGPFCAGASFEELLAISNWEEGTRFFSGFAHLINAMRKCPQPILGRIQGKAVGGGVGLAAACDYTFATQQSAIKLSELALGIGPFVIEPVLTKKIGKTAIGELALNPTAWKSAVWAYEKGLFTELFENESEMDTALTNFALQLASYAPEALAAIKNVLWEGTHHWDTLLLERAAISGRLVLSDFTKNALGAFKKS